MRVLERVPGGSSASKRARGNVALSAAGRLSTWSAEVPLFLGTLHQRQCVHMCGDLAQAYKPGGALCWASS